MRRVLKLSLGTFRFTEGEQAQGIYAFSGTKSVESVGPALPSAERRVPNGSFKTRNRSSRALSGTKSVESVGPLPSVERKVPNESNGSFRTSSR